MTNNSEYGIDEWISKAEGDFRVACRESKVEVDPHYDSVCFHVQQCIEKYLKALMVFHGVEPPRIHDLLALIRLLIPYQPEIKTWLNEKIAEINLGAVEIRYPGATTSYEEAIEQLETCTQFRAWLRQSLGLEAE